MRIWVKDVTGFKTEPQDGELEFVSIDEVDVIVREKDKYIQKLRRWLNDDYS